MEDNITRSAITENIKIQRLKRKAKIAVIIAVLLLMISSALQVYWNVFRFRFVKDGCVVIVDNQLAVGVEKIIRGEEANQIFLEKNAGYREIEEGNEVVLVKIKIKNITPWNAAPRYMEFKSYTGSDYEWTRELLYDVQKSYDGEYKVLDTSKVFKPGETRDGVFYYEVNKEKTLSKIKVYSFFPLLPRPSIDLSKRLLDKPSIYTLFVIILFLFCWLIHYAVLRKRQIKSAYYSIGIIYFLINILTYSPMIIYYVIKDNEFHTLYFGFLLIVLLILIAYYLNLRRYLFLFYWLKKEDLSCIVHEFKKKLGWETSEIREQIIPKYSSRAFSNFFYDAIIIQNEKTKEAFTFTINSVKGKKLALGIKNLRAILTELFNQTQLDWVAYYIDIFLFSIGFSIFFILYLFAIVFLYW